MSVDELRELATTGRLYAVVDACDAPSVPMKALEVGESGAVSLYSGSAQDNYWSLAPYLFRVDLETLAWIQHELWKEPWGIFAVTDASFETLRRHFKKFLVVQVPGPERWYFRFYDPRVLTVFLATCEEDQLRELFGPVRAYAASHGDGEPLALLRRSRAAPLRPLVDPRPLERPIRFRIRSALLPPSDGSPAQGNDGRDEGRE